MGHGIARNLLKRGFNLTVIAHRHRSAVDDLVRRGAVEVSSAADIALSCDAIFLCVANADQVQEVVEGSNGLASAAARGLVVIDCTTSSPERIIGLQARHPDLIFVDAPLGRSPAEAWEGRLSTFVGASEPTLDRIRPMLDAFADTVQLIGPLGSGQKLKLINNFVSLGYAALYSEALTLTVKSGLSVGHFDQLIRTSRMDCQFFHTFISWALNGDATVHRFSLRNADETIRHVEGMSRTLALGSELVAAIGEIYHRAIARGMGDAELPELPRSTALGAGVDLRPPSTTIA
jgi:3-hydroxyisobutyrate dehydrogenase-like beta-hydroxyacid dehydrogenase